jgi:hypothetical protein
MMIMIIIMIAYDGYDDHDYCEVYPQHDCDTSPHSFFTDLDGVGCFTDFSTTNAAFLFFREPSE